MPRPLGGMHADHCRQGAEILRENFFQGHGVGHSEPRRLERAAGLRLLFGLKSMRNFDSITMEHRMAYRQSREFASCPLSLNSTTERGPLHTSSDSGKPDFADLAQIYGLFGLPKIMVVLNGQPTLRRAAESLGKAQCHFGAETAGPGENAMHGGGRNAELGGQLAAAKIVGLQINLCDELTGMRGIVHGHQW